MKNPDKSDNWLAKQFRNLRIRLQSLFQKIASLLHNSKSKVGQAGVLQILRQWALKGWAFAKSIFQKVLPYLLLFVRTGRSAFDKIRTKFSQSSDQESNKSLRFFPKKIHHLIRYFVIGGLAAFVLYWIFSGISFSLLFIGPAVYLAYWLKQFVASIFGGLPSSNFLNDFVFLLPATIVYFGFIGFQLKQLWNERGLIRTVSLVALIVFLLYIHYRAFENLLGYYITPTGI